MPYLIFFIDYNTPFVVLLLNAAFTLLLETKDRG